jgi:DNA-binding GntR family transcriptional regulator
MTTPKKGEILTMSADRAYELIKERIASLELDPGVPVEVISLARQVGMPPGPVADAVETLTREGWLERVDPGVKVTEDALASILSQSFEERFVLETLCGRLAVERASEEQLAQLEAMMPQFEEAARAADPQAWIQLDQRFHEIIYRSAGNLFLEATLRGIYTLELRIWYLVLDRITDLPRIVEGHRAIVRALRERDVRAAERAFVKHLEDARAVAQI